MQLHVSRVLRLPPTEDLIDEVQTDPVRQVVGPRPLIRAPRRKECEPQSATAISASVNSNSGSPDSRATCAALARKVFTLSITPPPPKGMRHGFRPKVATMNGAGMTCTRPSCSMLGAFIAWNARTSRDSCQRSGESFTPHATFTNLRISDPGPVAPNRASA